MKSLWTRQEYISEQFKKTRVNTPFKKSLKNVQEQFMSIQEHHKFFKSSWTVTNSCSWMVQVQLFLNSLRIRDKFHELFLNCSWI